MFSLIEIEQALIGTLTVKNVIHAVTVVNTTRAFNYACGTIMIWDMLLTFSEEVALVWKARWTLIKIIFLLNRYATPLVIAINIWLMTGLASGLTDKSWFSSCRGWLSVACLFQVFSVSSVSLAIALRLFAMYETTKRTFYYMMGLSLITLIASLAILIKLLFAELEYLVHEPIMNLCITIAPSIWYQWLPRTVEHGLLCLFLIANAMGTPRPSRTPALAVLYRDGILFYFCTFTTFLGSLLVWRYLGRLYMGVALCPTWIFCQLAVSHLLLDTKTTSMFRHQDTTTTCQTLAPSYTVTHTPLQVLSQQGSLKHPGRVIEVTDVQALGYNPQNRLHLSRDVPRVRYSVSATYPRTPLDIEEVKTELEPSPRRTVQTGGLHRRNLWWMFRGGRGSQTDIHVEIDPEDDEDSGWAWGDMGGVKESRLGRFDHWL